MRSPTSADLQKRFRKGQGNANQHCATFLEGNVHSEIFPLDLT